MNENLAQMLKNETSENDEVTEPSFVVENKEPETPVDEVEEKITVKPLSTWFEEHHSKFEKINQVKVAIRGVDADSTVIVTIPDSKNEKDENGNLKRKVRIFEEADQTPVIDLDPVSMDIYNNGFKIVYDYNETTAIKCYGVKTGLIVVFCNRIDNFLVPYKITKMKKKDKEMVVDFKDPQVVIDQFPEIVDKENLQLLYRQITKSVPTINTNKEAIDWFLIRQDEVTDVNHLLQIDEVLCYILE